MVGVKGEYERLRTRLREPLLLCHVFLCVDVEPFAKQIGWKVEVDAVEPV